jgi:hypothetical protein
MPVEMKLQHVPAMRGATWVRHGFRAFALRPLAFMALLFTYTFASMLLMQVPWLGLVALAFPPLLALVFMLGTQSALRGQAPTQALFATPFRAGRAQTMSLVKIGVGFLVLSVGIVFLGHWVDGGRLAKALVLMSQADSPAAQTEWQELIVSPEVQFAMLLRFALIAVLVLLSAHTAALVHWGGHGAGKAVFFATVAAWRNKLAYVVYAATAFFVQLAFSVVTSLVFMLAGPQVAWLLMMLASVVLATVFCTSLFFTFVDSFEASITPLPED